MNPFEVWAEKVMREVEEGGRCAKRITLTGDGHTYETWEPVMGLEPAKWCQDAETLVAMLTEELPAKRIQLVFTAETEGGAVLSTHLKTVTGRNKNAADLGTQAGAKALADSIASVAKTTDFVLQMAQRMMEFQAKMLEAREGELAKRDSDLRDAHALIAMVQKIEIEEGLQGNAVSSMLIEQLKEAAPLGLQLVQHLLEKNQAAKAAAAAVAKGPAAAPAAATVKTIQTNGATQ